MGVAEFYDACIRIATDNREDLSWASHCGEEDSTVMGNNTLYIAAYELFREFQHMQPETDSMTDAIDQKFNTITANITSQIRPSRPV